MLGEQHLEVSVGDGRGVVDQFPIGHRRQIGAVRSQLVHQPFVLEHVGQVGCGEHPVERLADLLGQFGTVEAGLDDELGNARGVTEERVVDVLRRHPRRTVTEHPQRAGVQVGVPAGDAEEHALVVGQLVGSHRPDAVVGVAEPHLGPAEAAVVLEVLRTTAATPDRGTPPRCWPECRNPTPRSDRFPPTTCRPSSTPQSFLSVELPTLAAPGGNPRLRADSGGPGH